MKIKIISYPWYSIENADPHVPLVQSFFTKKCSPKSYGFSVLGSQHFPGYAVGIN